MDTKGDAAVQYTFALGPTLEPLGFSLAGNVTGTNANFVDDLLGLGGNVGVGAENFAIDYVYGGDYIQEPVNSGVSFSYSFIGKSLSPIDIHYQATETSSTMWGMQEEFRFNVFDWYYSNTHK